tara:strand:- start:533 stop:817 length:285 start_codon:yes stop_codon:yes gene_type:complete
MVNLAIFMLQVVAAVAVGVLAVHTHMVMDGLAALVELEVPLRVMDPTPAVDQVVVEMEEVLLQPLIQAAAVVVAAIMEQVVQMPVVQVEQEFVF